MSADALPPGVGRAQQKNAATTGILFALAPVDQSSVGKFAGGANLSKEILFRLAPDNLRGRRAQFAAPRSSGSGEARHRQKETA